MNRTMLPRVLTALIGLPLLISVIAVGRPWHFEVLIFTVTALALWEYYRMVFPGRSGRQISAILLGLCMTAGLRLFDPAGVGFLAAPLLGAALVCLSNGFKVEYAVFKWTVLGTYYIGYFFPHFFLLYDLPNGREWIFLLLLVIMAGDTAGYLIGSRFGKRKLAPQISPGKTMEGTVGLIAVGVAAGYWGARFLFPAKSSAEILGLSLTWSLLGVFGDLFESWIKRSFSVKDSSGLLPGHGGFLDRIDSLILPVVFTTHYVRVLHS